jgi:DNA-binding XRE family transcriptional regulator
MRLHSVTFDFENEHRYGFHASQLTDHTLHAQTIGSNRNSFFRLCLTVFVWLARFGLILRPYRKLTQHPTRCKASCLASSLFERIWKMPSRKPKVCSHRTRFGENIASLRSRQGLTQEKLAEKMSLSARYVQSVEAGEYFPSLPTLVRLRVALRCEWEELFDGCDKV